MAGGKTAAEKIRTRNGALATSVPASKDIIIKKPLAAVSRRLKKSRPVRKKSERVFFILRIDADLERMGADIKIHRV